MSLQVWLPLNGNFDNQGVYGNINFTQTGTISNVDGKIGQCKSFSSSNVIAPYTYTLGNSFSICLWVNWTTFPASDSNDWIIHLGKTSGYANAVAGLSCYHSTLITVMAGGKNDSSYTHGFTTGTWHHIAFTWRSSGSSYLYVDGELVKTYTNLTGGTVTAADKLSLGSNVVNSSTKFKGKLNDVRFYTNFLSAEEVKEISKGLILHFPLNKRGWGQENLITDTNFTSSFISSMAVSNAVNLGQWKRESSNVTLAMDGEYVKLHYETNTSRYGIHYEISLDPGTYTYSITAGGRMTCSFGLATSWPSTNIITANSPGRYRATFTVSETATYRMYIYTTSANPDIWFNWPKLEVGNKSTPWTPNSADVLYTTIGISNSIEYDASGYLYNGTRNSTFTWGDVAPKYNVSTKFTGTNYISLTSPTAEAKTLSIWAKWDTIPSGQSVVFLDYKSKLGLGLMSTGILCGTSGPGNFYTFSKSSLVANTWYHFVVVNTGAVTGTSRDLYINGVKQTQTSSTSNWSYSVDQTQIGKRNSTSDGFVGLLSDVRLYATALSANDVLSLYNNGAYIDSAGNIHGKIR